MPRFEGSQRREESRAWSICRRRVVAGLALLAIGAISRPAAAGLQICNDGPVPIDTAIGYLEGKSWKSAGWFSVQPGQCRRVLSGDLDSQYYYGYAESAGGKYVWGGDYPFCVSSEAFTLGQNCPPGGQYRLVGFDELDTGEAERYVWRLSCADCYYWADGALMISLPEVPQDVPIGGRNARVMLSGTAKVTFLEDRLEVEANIDAALGDFLAQAKRLIRDQAEVDERCGDRISLHRIELSEHGGRGRLSVGGKYERWDCTLGLNRLVQQGGSASVDITLQVAGGSVRATVSGATIEADGLLGELLDTAYLDAWVRQELANALPGPFELGHLNQVLPAELRPLGPELVSIRFVDLGEQVAIRGQIRVSVTGEKAVRVFEALQRQAM